MEEKFDLLKKWYDGYRFGSAKVYCPWDVINQCDKIEALFSGEPVEKILVPELTYTDLDSKDRAGASNRMRSPAQATPISCWKSRQQKPAVS